MKKYKYSLEHRMKISKGCKGKKWSKEAKERIREKRKGENCNFWKNGLSEIAGYITISKTLIGDYPSNKYHILYHRLIVEIYLHRFLDENETVHHINHNKKDNRLENLYLFSSNNEHLNAHKFNTLPNKSNLEEINEKENKILNL